MEDRRRASGAAATVALALIGLAPFAQADEPEVATPEAPPDSPAAAPIAASKAPSKRSALLDHDYTTARYEPAGIPLLGGNSDIGFQFGAVATLSRFADGIKPYAWNMDLVLSASVKDGPRGAEVAQESFLWNDDIPGLWGGRLRLNPQVSYQRTINMGYFGLG